MSAPARKALPLKVKAYRLSLVHHTITPTQPDREFPQSIDDKIGFAPVLFVCVLQHRECKRTAQQTGWKTIKRKGKKTSLIYFGCRKRVQETRWTHPALLEMDTARHLQQAVLRANLWCANSATVLVLAQYAAQVRPRLLLFQCQNSFMFERKKNRVQ